MRAVIIDERKGDVITDDMQANIDHAQVVMKIQSDGHVKVEAGGASTKPVTTRASFFEAPHRDEISAQESRDAFTSLEAQKQAAKPAEEVEEAMTRVRRALGTEA